MRSVVGPGKSLIVFTGFVLCCNVTNNVVLFSPFQGFFVGATSVPVWCYNNNVTLPYLTLPYLTTTIITIFTCLTHAA